MESTNSWPTNEDLFSMVSTDNVANDIFDTSPMNCVSTWDPDNNDWKADADWRLFGSDVPTMDPLPQPPHGGPPRTEPSSSLSSNNSSTAVVPSGSVQIACTGLGSSARMLPFRPTEPAVVSTWDPPQTQPLPQQPFPGPNANGLLIQMPIMDDPQMMHDSGIGLGIYNEQPQMGPSVAWNDNEVAFNSLQQQQPPAIPKLECDSPTDADDEAGDAGDQSYAKLLYECLLNAPGHMLPLKDIYTWMQQSTSKARDPNSKGWQNSVRHNLSMNQGFEKVQSSAGHGSKKGGAGLWRLSEEALHKGAIISTTRYRKEPKKRHGRRIGALPAPKRVASGAKGGRATRDGRDRQQRLQVKSYHHTSMPGGYAPRSNPFYCGIRTPGQYSSASAASSPMFSHSTISGPAFGGFFPQDLAEPGLPNIPVPQSTSSPMPGAPMPYQHPQQTLEQVQYMPTPDPSSDYFTDCETSPWLTTSSVTPDPIDMKMFNDFRSGIYQSPALVREQSSRA